MRLVRQLSLLIILTGICFRPAGEEDNPSGVGSQIATDPVYPPILKDRQIGGLVRIMVVVTPFGTVRQTERMGGNPVLMIAAQTAVKQWKYEPAPGETREVVTLRFDPFSHK